MRFRGRQATAPVLLSRRGALVSFNDRHDVGDRRQLAGERRGQCHAVLCDAHRLVGVSQRVLQFTLAKGVAEPDGLEDVGILGELLRKLGLTGRKSDGEVRDRGALAVDEARSI